MSDPAPPFERDPGASKTGEEGFSTAELLGNAALGIAALVVIWAALTSVGEQVITYIRGAILGG